MSIRFNLGQLKNNHYLIYRIFDFKSIKEYYC